MASVEASGNTAFDTPQRQSRVGILVEFAYTLQRTVRAFWPVFLYLAIRFKEVNFLYVGLGALLVLAALAVLAYLKYLNFVFHIDESRREFILHRGVFNKKRVVVQLSKIQQVNINQSFIQKMVDVYAVEIETAGSAKSEATIKAISKASALALKERLLDVAQNKKDRVAPPGEGEIAVETPPPFITISLGSLAKVGITSNYIESFTLLLAFLYTIYSNVKDVWWNEKDQESRLQDLASSLVITQSLLVVFGILVVVTFLINLLRMMIPYFHFNIRKQGPSLLLSYGLVNSKNTLLRPHKVQVVKLITNYLQRKMDVLRMVIRQASSDIRTDKKASIQIPGCSGTESKTILKLIFGKHPQKGIMLKPNIRRIISSIGIFIFIPMALYVAVALANPLAYQYRYLLPIYLMVVSAFIYFSYQNNRLFINDQFIIKQHGIWDIHTEIIEPFKIQAITTRQNFWHRRVDIGHVTLHTAGGDITFRFADFSRVKPFVDYWLYQVESSEEAWM